MTTDRSIPWGRVALFFVIACAWSWPLFWFRDMQPAAWRAWGIPDPLKTTLLMWGPGLAALACMRMRPNPRPRTTVFGGHALRSLAFYVVPILALAAVGVESPEFGPEPARLMVLAIALVGFVNVLGEELGWRGYLQDALAGVTRARRYGLIAALWAGWHFTNLWAGRDGGELMRYLAVYLPVTLLLSLLIGEATARSRAIAVAVTLHAWVNLSWEFAGLRTTLVALAAVPFWAWLLWTWPRPAAQVPAVGRPVPA